MDIYNDKGLQTIKLFNNEFDCIRMTSENYLNM
ncbi:hypothetical protein FGHELIBC_00016 [Camelpox virus]|uniref:Uncharacterized protein n=1 Tax=Camelpox virus TaxID=28873 RepID=A0A0K1LDL3_9POXV|nr:hypothetical protein TT95_00015 [Camelpox virus]QCW07317.1 hypothetical protein FGHELIBC_00016 [Camelpox virus]WIG62209.1 hypothetical protein DIBLKBHL_00010 [Camelpox virus]